MLDSSPPLPSVYLDEQNGRWVHGRMLNKNQFVTQIGSESFFLDVFLPIPHGLIIDDSQTMETHRSQWSGTTLLSESCSASYNQLEKIAHNGNVFRGCHFHFLSLDANTAEDSRLTFRVV